MPHRTVLLAALMLAGCEPALVAESVETGPQDSPGLDLSLTQGHTADDHTEVAPGVFMLTSLHQGDEIRFLHSDVVLDHEMSEEEHKGAVEVDTSLASPTNLGPNNYCYNNDFFNYTQQTDPSLFMERPTLYGYGGAYSYSYNNGQYAAHMVYAGAYTYANYVGGPIDYLYAYAYVYIEGRYVGYVYQYSQNANTAYAYGYWQARCDSDLSIDAQIITRNYAYDFDGSYISAGTTRNLSARCCL